MAAALASSYEQVARRIRSPTNHSSGPPKAAFLHPLNSNVGRQRDPRPNILSMVDMASGRCIFMTTLRGCAWLLRLTRS